MVVRALEKIREKYLEAFSEVGIEDFERLIEYAESLLPLLGEDIDFRVVVRISDFRNDLEMFCRFYSKYLAVNH
ncbi:MAG: hypothetical protein ABDH32_05325 [Candidatus Caldarchaeales archaeon]